MKLKPAPASINLALISFLSMSEVHAVENSFSSVNKGIPSEILPAVKVRDKAQQEDPKGPLQGYTARRSSTATKTDTPIIETPQSISVIGSEFIRESGATNIKESIAYTPGITIPWGTDSRYDWISIRGFDAYSPGFNQDGLLTLNTGGYAVWYNNPFNIERIEILRGPSAALYGLSQPGGILNAISKRPGEFLENEFRVQIGDNNHRQVATDLSGTLKKNSSISYRLIGVLQDSQTAGGGLPDDQTMLAPSLKWEPNATTSLTLLSNYTKRKGSSTYAALPLDGTLLPNPNGQIPFPAKFNQDAPHYSNQDQWSIGYELKKTIGEKWKIEQNARYAKIKLGAFYLWSSASFNKVNEENPSALENFRSLNRSAFFANEWVKNINLDTRIQGSLEAGGLRHNIVVGVDLLRMKADLTSGFGGEVDPIDLFSGQSGGRYTLPSPDFINNFNNVSQSGLYVQNTIKHRSTSFLMTIRHDRSSIKVNDRTSETESRNENRKTTGRIGISHLFDNGTSTYASFSTSYFPVLESGDNTGNPFEPETGRQFEIGLKHEAENKNLSYGLGFYDLRRNNYVTNDPVTERRTQTGQVAARGFEAEAKFKPTPLLNILSSYTFTEKFEVTKSSNSSEVGKPIKGIPNHQLALWADYKLPKGFKFGLGARYIGSHQGDLNSAPKKVPAYTIYDAALSYEQKNWRISLNARNLTNKRTLAFCADWGCGYGDPRRVIATGTYRW